MPKTTDLKKTAEILLARRIQLSERLKQIEHANDEMIRQEGRLRPKAKTKKETQHLDNNYARLVGNATKLQAETAGELAEVIGLLRALPIRQQRTTVDLKNVRSLVAQANLFKTARDARLGLYGDRGLGGALLCDTCVTSCTECVTSCTSDCVTSCTSECISACTACSPSDTTGCVDTLGMQSLFSRPEKTGDPEELKLLGDDTDRTDIEW